MALLMRLIIWILRLLAWPWAGRSSERWPAAPQSLTAETTQPPMGKGPRDDGSRMGFATAINFALAGSGRPAP